MQANAEGGSDSHGETPTNVDSAHTPDDNPVARLACAQCRQRKIACTREIPCSYCVKTGSECTYAPRQRPTVRKQRMHLSAQYEQRIDNIEAQLEHITGMLSSISANLPTHAATTHAAATHHAVTPAPSMPRVSRTPASSSTQAARGTSGTHTPFEGESSLAAHTAFANHLLESAVSHEYSRGNGDGDEMREVLASMRDVSVGPDQPTAAHDMLYPLVSGDVVPGINLDDHPMPPIEMVMATVRMMKETSQLEYMGFNLFLPPEKFMDCVIKVFFPGGFSLAEFIIVNSCLMDIFLKRLFTEALGSPARRELQGYVKMCQRNMENGLARLPVHMPNDTSYILAMLRGVQHAIQLSKTSIAWTLVCTALHMCQSAGFHRVQSMAQDTHAIRNQKLWIFWTLYSTEKGLSLRLGRASVTCDADITVPIPEPDPANPSPYASCAIRWFKLSSIHGKIYRRLYSPASFAEPDHVRASWVNTLVRETKVLSAESQAEQAQEDGFWKKILGHTQTLVYQSEEVGFLSTIVSALRVLPAQQTPDAPFSPECIEAARNAIGRHQDYADAVSGQDEHFDVYMSWTVLYTPFVPFIVLFCNVIIMRDPDDLARLDRFVKTLQKTVRYSEGSKASPLQFEVLFKAASRYLQIKGASDSCRPQMQELDAYIQAVTAIPAPGGSGGGWDVPIDEAMNLDGFGDVGAAHEWHLEEWLQHTRGTMD